MVGWSPTQLGATLTSCLGACFCACQVGIKPRLGVKEYSPPLGSVAEHKDGVYVSPNGVMFAPRSHRRGVLPQMLQEILDTRHVPRFRRGHPCNPHVRLTRGAWCFGARRRIMVKKSMKRPDVANDPVMTRVMHARQLALKLLANVTYGYTSAGYSGRMPCAEIADAIVQSVRWCACNAST